MKIDLYCLQKKCSPKNLVFSDISFMAIFVAVTEKYWLEWTYPVQKNFMVTVPPRQCMLHRFKIAVKVATQVIFIALVQK